MTALTTETMNTLIAQARQTDRVYSLDFAVDLIRGELAASGPRTRIELGQMLYEQGNAKHRDAALAVLMLADEIEQDDGFYDLTA